MWLALFVLGLGFIATGVLPWAESVDLLLHRAAPIMVFLLAVTVVARLSKEAGLFDVAAHWCARAAGGSVVRLYLLVAALATVTTVLMSLDTTAVLLTPVVLTLVKRLRLSPLPFAFIVVWLANTASLLLPVSNLTNLLALQQLDASVAAFVATMAVPQLVAVLTTTAFIGLLYRRHLRGSFAVPAAPAPADRWLLWTSAAACVVLGAGVVAGIEPWLVALPLALGLTAIFTVRQRTALRLSLLPWQTVLFTLGLFVVVTALVDHGGRAVLADLAGNGTFGAVLTAAGASNLVNNLPAYLAMEQVVTTDAQLFATLLGTNLGPMIFLWASLANLLWREQCRSFSIELSHRRFIATGLLGVPIVLGTTYLSLVLTT